MLLGDVLVAEGIDLDEFDDLSAFGWTVLHPGRTLLEKLVLIHALAQQLIADPSRPIAPRSGRHFYDVYQLLGDGRVCELLEDRDEVRDILASVEEITERHFGGQGSEVRPRTGFSACLAFDPESEVSNRLRAGYETTMPARYSGRLPFRAGRQSAPASRRSVSCYGAGQDQAARIAQSQDRTIVLTVGRGCGARVGKGRAGRLGASPGNVLLVAEGQSGEPCQSSPC